MKSSCEISKEALQNNYKTLRDIFKPSKVAPVLKANAYGHGLEVAYEALAPLDPPILCVNYFFEAARLRELGYKNRIISVGPSFLEDLEPARKIGAEITIGGEDLLEEWLSLENKGKIHLKFDTGLSRQGLYPEKAEEYSKKIDNFSSFLQGISMHFANVEDVTKQSYAKKQLSSFLEVKNIFQKAFGSSFECHSAASAPSLLMQEGRFDFCRVGISLYGFWPSDLTKLSFLSMKPSQLPSLEPVLTWKTKIASVRKIKKGTPVGYGCTYTATQEMTIAVIPIGYYEGLPRYISNRGAYVLVQGKPCALLGRICMNMSIIDVSNCSVVKTGDEVVLIGKQEDSEIRAETLAEWSGTIQYEIVTRIHESVERRLVV